LIPVFRSIICNLTGKYEKKWTDILSVYFFFRIFAGEYGNLVADAA